MSDQSSTIESNSNFTNESDYSSLAGICIGDWYSAEEPQEEIQKRLSRPLDHRRVGQLAQQRLAELEKQQINDGIASNSNLPTDTSTPILQPPTNANPPIDYDNFDAEEDDENFASNYGSIFEEYNPSKYSEFSKSLLRRMGYNIDTIEGLQGGLGKNGTGIVNPIEGDLSRWGTTAGLGSLTQIRFTKHVYKKPEIELSIPVVWVPRLDEENICMPPLADQEDFSYNEDFEGFNSLNSWTNLRVKTISYIDTTYCSIDIQLELFGAKSKFDDVGNDQFLDARNKSNPYELLKREYFQNRAALKMAELDAECDHIFTNPPCYKNENAKKPSPFYWGDVCAGPGGFSEFMSTIVKWKGKGFGFTLKAENDFQLEKFNKCTTPQTFKGYYGDGSGDVTRSSNLISYSDEIYQGTGGTMLHVLMADGGFSVAGKENYQELLSRQLLLCQCAAALLGLRKGGVCVIKMFDNFLRFTIDCILLMRLAFEDVAIVKPHQSRPANSERYLVCKGLRAQGGINHPIAQYMLRVNDMMNQIDPLHQQSGLVQTADQKPLLFLSAGILSGAQVDNNEDIDADGNIIKVRPKLISHNDDDDTRSDKKRTRQPANDFEDNGNDGDEMDGTSDHDGSTDAFFMDRDIFMEFYDDPFTVEYLPLLSDCYDDISFHQEEQMHSDELDDANNNINLARIPFSTVFDPYTMSLPPEPKIDPQLLSNIYEFSSTYLYTDKYKLIEKEKKLLKQRGLDPSNEQSYVSKLQDIIITGQTIHSIVPMKFHDPDFRQYVRHWNENYALQQIQWLHRVYQYIEDPSLPADDQARTRTQCLQRWKIILDQTQESTEGFIHWNPLWGRLWCDPDMLLLRGDLKSQRLIEQAGQTNQSTLFTSGSANESQLHSLRTGQYSMSAFTSRGGIVKNDPPRTAQMNGRQIHTIVGDNIFGNNPRYLERYKQHYNFCKYIYYNTFCIDMSFALKWIGLDLVNLPHNILFDDLRNPQIYNELRRKLTDLLSLWFKYIHLQRPMLNPPTGVIGDKNSILQSRETNGTKSTNWAVLPIPALAKRCLLLSVATGKRNAEFNKSLISLIIPHHHSMIVSPQNIFDFCPGLSNPSVYTKSMNPLLVQLVATAQDSFDQQDPLGDQPQRRPLLPNAKSIFQSHQIPNFVPMEPLSNIFNQDFNISKEQNFTKSAIQHDLFHDPVRSFPGDMLFDTFINVDPPSQHQQQLHQQANSSGGAAQPLAPARLRTLIYDAWSLPHHTEPSNGERYMYEKLAYTDRYQNLNILGDTMRIKEPVPKQPLQNFNSHKLAHHTRHSISPPNSNNMRRNKQGTLNALEITRAWDMPLFLKSPLEIWNTKIPPQFPEERSRCKDNLFLIQKGHKLYSLSIWVSLFSITANPPSSLSNRLTTTQKQERDTALSHKPAQSDEDVLKVYSILKELQQKSIRDALAATLGKV